MDNLALQITEEETQQGFIIDNDSTAEWALKRIAEERAEMQRYVNVCESMILEYKLKIEKAKEQLDSKTAWLSGQLQAYFEKVEHKKTKTAESYKLPSGTLKLKYGTPEFVRDDKAFVEWLEVSRFVDYVEVKKTPKWGEFKKDAGIKVVGDSIVTIDGEVVDGVKAMERPAAFEVEI